jgi:DNA (cytosine-5)-methyltransferase 1
MLKVGSDFSGVGAFNQSLMRLGVSFDEVFACDMDKYARDTFIHNYGEPKYYPTNVYDREIPSESLDIYMTSPPCQAFSLAGKRLGKDDKRGILFFNSHEFIQVNKPRFFIFENVKGLLSDDGGKTFQEWVNMLGGKSVNGLPVLFPVDEAVPYHLYWKVLNAKHHGVPQNRERVFLIGIRDDKDNSFQYPKEEHLEKRLKDVLEDDVDEKYFLSDERIEYLVRHDANKNILTEDIPNESKTCIAGYYKAPRDCQYLKVKSATSKGYEEAKEGDSINFSVPTSETRIGRVGKGVAQTLDTGCNQAVIYKDKRLNETIAKNELPNGEIKAIDTYNKKVQDNAPTLTEPHHNTTRLWDGTKIRRLTPRECFRLMDFPDTFTWKVSDSQAYKQAGNSIVVNVLYKILKQLPL